MSNEMMSVFKDSANGLPVPASLFYRDPDGLNGIGSTWNMLRRNNIGTRQIDTLFKKQGEYGSRGLTFLVYHASDPECVCNPFLGKPSASEILARLAAWNPGYDDAELNRWKGILLAGKQPGVCLVPSIFCGDDTATMRNVEFCNWFLPQAVFGLYEYSVGFNLGSEVGKSLGKSDMRQRVLTMKWTFDIMHLAPKPIFIHNQGWDIPEEADGLFYELSYNPNDGKDHDVDFVMDEIKDVLRKLPVHQMLGIVEMDIDPETELAKDKTRKIVELAKSEPRIVWLPGPV